MISLKFHHSSLLLKLNSGDIRRNNFFLDLKTHGYLNSICKNLLRLDELILALMISWKKLTHAQMT